MSDTAAERYPMMEGRQGWEEGGRGEWIDRAGWLEVHL